MGGSSGKTEDTIARIPEDSGISVLSVLNSSSSLPSFMETRSTLSIQPESALDGLTASEDFDPPAPDYEQSRRDYVNVGACSP